MSNGGAATSGAGTTSREALLVLADGTLFEGHAIGWWEPDAPRAASGEVVFNTTLTGYQEVLTDPSYAGQIVCFTYPHIGNYGITAADNESRRAFCRGLIVRELSPRPSSWRSERQPGRVPGPAAPPRTGGDRHPPPDPAHPRGRLHAGCVRPGQRSRRPRRDGAQRRGPGRTGHRRRRSGRRGHHPRRLRDRRGPLRVVAYDFGIKRAILRHLGHLATVEVVPASTPAADVLARQPDGVFLSNGPGDPAAVGYATGAIRDLLGQVPVFGICLGHQLLATALGAATCKLPFGHHGGNHPVRRVATDTVEITSQNHNYAVAAQSLPGVDVTHVNLNDGVIEGLACRDVPAFGVQYHPEAGPGPHDASYLFEEFRALMAKGA